MLSLECIIYPQKVVISWGSRIISMNSTQHLLWPDLFPVEIDKHTSSQFVAMSMADLDFKKLNRVVHFSASSNRLSNISMEIMSFHLSSNQVCRKGDPL